MVKRKLMIGAVAAALTLGGTAALANGTGTSGSVSNQANLSAGTAGVQTQNVSKAAMISPEQAKEAALKAQKGIVDDIELKTKNGKSYYKVEIDRTQGSDVDVWVDAYTASILKVVNDDNDDDGDQARSGKQKSTVSSAVKITSAQAGEIAVDQAGGGKVTDIDLDKDNGRYIYEIEVKTAKGEADVEVDAATGKVLSYEEDFDDNGDNDDNDDNDYEDDQDDD
ncbi:PepSY domain-containing protein [Saccharibacillus kuerlensis]|uniref:Lipoprotein n=1 Tax=Saccharibacillus kuerlensis TaxID=459527 RepID=A0ABQ2L6X2_9BACL|nr:PepSY domain-containing protein [Saccharibacillus kuerlensis]GGO05498.1 lipoprotein [Saccharibacillus kuerlensis]